MVEAIFSAQSEIQIFLLFFLELEFQHRSHKMFRNWELEKMSRGRIKIKTLGSCVGARRRRGD